MAPSPRENLYDHYNNYGSEVGAKNLEDYANKARNMQNTVLDKRIKSTKRVSGYTSNVYRYHYNGRYIDLEMLNTSGQKYNVSNFKIVSFGVNEIYY